MRKIEDLINLSDIILDKLENIHIDAKGTVLGEPKSINIGIDISDLNNAEMEITCWDERNPIRKWSVRKKQQLVSQIMKWTISCRMKRKQTYWNVYGKQKVIKISNQS